MNVTGGAGGHMLPSWPVTSVSEFSDQSIEKWAKQRETAREGEESQVTNSIWIITFQVFVAQTKHYCGYWGYKGALNFRRRRKKTASLFTKPLIGHCVLSSDWSMMVTWYWYCPLIGRVWMTPTLSASEISVTSDLSDVEWLWVRAAWNISGWCWASETNKRIS